MYKRLVNKYLQGVSVFGAAYSLYCFLINMSEVFSIRWIIIIFSRC